MLMLRGAGRGSCRKAGGSGSQIKHWPFTDCSKTNTIEMNILNNIVSSANAIKA